jgi:hypothetical protein
MNILKDNCDPLEYVVSLFNTSCNTHITKKQIIRNCIQYLPKKMKNNTNVPINEILSTSIPLV